MIAPIPNDYSLSPANATPHLVINHDVANDLDSSNAFEGPEKLLEVWFAPSPSALPASAKPTGLKAVASDTWVTMLDLVNCKILSVLESDSVDAYLLSESSMFVFPHKLILKTCGTTTLLLGLQRMLQIAASDAGFPFHNSKVLDDSALATPYRVFYSRKNFLFPDKQRGPHRSWKSEVRFLDDTFDGGSAYMVGKMNGDHWYLYMTNQMTQPPSSRNSLSGSPPRLRKIPTGTLDGAGRPEATDEDQHHDETLEILMTDLDPENAKQFYFSQEMADSEAVKAATKGDDEDGVFANADSDLHTAKPTDDIPSEGHALGSIVTESCGLANVFPTSAFPDARIDSYLFTPCGYSANGLVPPPPSSEPAATDGTPGPGQYWTVHVTPEPHCSFASFETNVPAGQGGLATAEVIDRVLNVFKPGRFSITLFDGGKNSDSAAKAAAVAQRLGDEIAGYRRIDGITHDFEDYDLVFRFYEREGWAKRTGTRVGEE
jgi:S-adenosylmethionine decarboxylase